MTSSLNIVIIITIAIVVFILAATHIIGKLIDKKIGDIRVNVPKIKVQPPNVVIRMNPKLRGSHELKVDPPKKRPQRSQDLKHPNAIQLYEPFLSVNFDNTDLDNKPPAGSAESSAELDGGDRTIVIDSSTPPTQPRIAVGCTKDADCNVVNGNGLNVCKIDGTCNCVGGGSGLFCHYGPVNFRDPKDMSEEERYRFKSKYRANMTLQDYKNWLMLYKPDPTQLNEEHRRNLRVLLQGGQITTKDVPAIRVRAPTNASDYFQRMYRDGNIAVNFPDQDGPYVGANYGQYDSFEPPENAASNAITGVVNAYQTGKDDARAVDWYVRPPVTVGEDEQRAGDIYQKYTEQMHTLADIRGAFSTASNPDVPIPTEVNLKSFGGDGFTAD